MYQSSEPQRGRSPVAATAKSPVSVIGAGIAGAWQALLFAQAGHEVTLHERSDAAMTQSTSHWAGGMLAPWCEAEASEPRDRPARHPLARPVARAFSANAVQRLAGGGACARPRRFRTFCQTHLRPSPARRRGVTEIEPSLEGRFREGLFYPDEGHVEPRRVLPQLHARIDRGRRHDPIQQRSRAR